MNRGRLLAAGVALVMPACGGGADVASEERRAVGTAPVGSADRVDVRCARTHAPRYRACELFVQERRARATIEVRAAPGRWRAVAHEPRGAKVEAYVHGHWLDAWLSPDGRTLLAQWSGECEIPHAFVLPAGGGPLRPVTGERDWRTSPESVALGWLADGRARVRLLEGLCGHGARRPGIYAIDPRTAEATLLDPSP